jgi:hypothetical protein
MLGYLGGKTFEHHPWWGLALALAGALTLSFSVEVGRHLWSRHKARAA